jgi:REP element-mobilizing transposase RayT
MTETRKLRVFLCHSSQDKPIVRELCRRLSAEGWIDPWLDEEKLLPGMDWDIEIEKAVEAADAVIVCLSNNSVTKEGYVQKELRFVLDIAFEKPEETIFIIPLRLDDVRPSRRLKTWQYVDYFPAERKNSTYGRILAALKNKAHNLGISIIRASGFAIMPYTFLLVIRNEEVQLTGEIADALDKTFYRVCDEFDWRLNFLSVRPRYIECNLLAQLDVPPVNIIDTVKRETSLRLKELLPDIVGFSKGLWASGYLLISGPEPIPQNLKNEYLERIQKQQVVSHNQVKYT